LGDIPTPLHKGETGVGTYGIPGSTLKVARI
jgi:hypothetical protein